MILEILKCIYRTLFLPFAWGADDRIEALRLYKACISLPRQQEERNRVDSTFSRLIRAAKRQERINRIEIPLLAWVMRNRWKRSANYFWFIRRATFILALGWGVAALSPMWHQISPRSHRVAVSAVHAAIHAFGRAVDAITPPPAPSF